jgi:2-polyprenyl-3-methyl-5-hydroxy-6-metoxy-1,4-benzoquinol methylase
VIYSGFAIGVQEHSLPLGNDSDRAWKTWAKTDPYFGVLSDPKFLNANLNDDSLQDFFASGERHVAHVYSVIRASLRPDFQPVQVLDFGCGVGRLVIPLAKRAQAVVGVDVSSEMLEQARVNCERFSVVPERLINVSELGSLTPASFDLVHSFIVFQHIPVARGELILRQLIALIAEGGVGAIHITYSNTHSTLRRCVSELRRRINLVHGLLNLVQRKPFSTPLMQMNSYSMNRVFNILTDGQCSNLHVEFSNHGGIYGAMLYFEKVPRSLL